MLYLDFAGTVSTPVIDVAKGIIYVVNECTKNTDSSDHWYITALDITTGNTILKGSTPVLAEIAYSPSSSKSWQPSGPRQTFFAISQMQRASLLLAGNLSGSESVIVGFGTGTYEGGSNAQNYQGWMFDYDVSNPTSNGIAIAAPTNPFSTQCQATSEVPTAGTVPCTSTSFSQPTGSVGPNPCSDGGGTWMSSRAPAAASGNVFFAAGNGGFQYCAEAYGCTTWCTYNPPTPGSVSLTTAQQFTDWGNAVMKINMNNVWGASSTATQPAPFWPGDYFLPYTVPSSITDPPVDLDDCGSGGTSSCTMFQVLNEQDWDMGIFGVVAFDDCYYDSGTSSTNCSTSMAFAGNKRGDGYSMLQSSLGQYISPDSDVASFYLNPGAPNPNCTRSINSVPECDEVRSVAYWKPANMPTGTNPPGGFLVAWPWSESLSSYQWSYVSGQSCVGFLVAYKLDVGSSCTSGTLTKIWPLSLPTNPDFLKAPYAIPTIVNGKAYVPTFGLYDTLNNNYDRSGVQVYACSTSDCS